MLVIATMLSRLYKHEDHFVHSVPGDRSAMNQTFCMHHCAKQLRVHRSDGMLVPCQIGLYMQLIHAGVSTVVSCQQSCQFSM